LQRLSGQIVKQKNKNNLTAFHPVICNSVAPQSLFQLDQRSRSNIEK